ncbi:MAG: serine O-acetyltransferase [Hyalangium sp.]|uniref:serine O-acetyltransferase n=1 Tax=Hyalangium sp. TaxID=2028555 RepID=UPI003899A083
MQSESFWHAFREDLRRYFAYLPNASLGRKLTYAVTLDGIWAASVYRLGRALETARLGPLKPLLRAVHGSLEVALRFFSGIHLDSQAEIAPGFYVGHFGSIYVGPGVRIGRHCNISQVCFIAAAEDGSGAPVIGERVYLGAGCKIVGNVRIGDGAAIGANAVVVDDVPANGVVAGVPAQLISYKGSGDFILLEGS